jgi:hypothetical protein
LASSPVLIDNTPPVITLSAPERKGSQVTLRFAAQVQATPLTKCAYSIDAGPWQPLEAADGITDSKQEEFQLQVDELKPGEHLIAIRVYDSGGNAGLAKAVVH